MPNVKFSDFLSDSFLSAGTYYLVGLDPSNQNVKVSKTDLAFALSSLMNLGSIGGSLDLSGQTSGILDLAKGGTNATNADDALTNITSAATRSLNDILQFTGAGWQISSPCDNTNIPIVATASYAWTGINPYYTFTSLGTNIIPYDSDYFTYTTYTNSDYLPIVNYVSATVTTFSFTSASYNSIYKIEVQSHFTNQGTGHSMQVFVLDGSNNIIGMVTNEHTQGGAHDKMYYGYCYFMPQLGSDTIKISAVPNNVCTGTNTQLGLNLLTISLAKRA